jgi:hypothetical protein
MASIGDENANCAPAQRTGSPAMPHRQGFKQLSTLEYRLAQEWFNLRKQAEGMPLSVRRDERLRKAEQIDAATQINKWLTSPGMRAPT